MHDRDTLLASVDLRALADELLGPAGTNGRARMWPCPNPQHHQTGRTPPVSIFTGRRGDQRWRCHGCGDGGTAIDLVMAVRRGTVADAMAELAQRTGNGFAADPVRRPSAPGRAGLVCVDPDGLAAYVRDCSTRLRTASGAQHLHWLTDDRGLPVEVLVRNHIGSDPGSGLQRRPDGMPRSGGIVLPVVVDGRAVYAQVRAIDRSPDGPRYLNPRSDLAPNPRIARIRPAHVTHPEVIVTEGIIDGLSAATAGYRAAAVLSATVGDEAVATHLANLPHPLVMAFDSDDAGAAGAQRLTALLAAGGRPTATLDLDAGTDLNDALRNSTHWDTEMADRVAAARSTLGVGIGSR